MKLICVSCRREMIPEKNGVGVLYHRWLRDTKEHQAFKITDADIHTCPKCYRQVVTGFASVSEYRPSQEFWNAWERHQNSNSIVLCYDHF